jgi:hypothetical protein
MKWGVEHSLEGGRQGLGSMEGSICGVEGFEDDDEGEEDGKGRKGLTFIITFVIRVGVGGLVNGPGGRHQAGNRGSLTDEVKSQGESPLSVVRGQWGSTDSLCCLELMRAIGSRCGLIVMRNSECGVWNEGIRKPGTDKHPPKSPS